MNEFTAIVAGLTQQHLLILAAFFVLGYFARHHRWAVPLLPKAPASEPAIAVRPSSPADRHGAADVPAHTRAATILQDARDKSLVADAERLATAQAAPKT